MTTISAFWAYFLYNIGKLFDRSANFFYREAHVQATIGRVLFQAPPTDRNLYVIVYKKDDTAFVSMGYDNVWDKEALKRKYMLSKGDVVYMESIQDFRKNGLNAIWQEEAH